MKFGPLSAYLPMNHYHTLATGRPRAARVEGLILPVAQLSPGGLVLPFSIRSGASRAADPVPSPVPIWSGWEARPGDVAVGSIAGSLALK